LCYRYCLSLYLLLFNLIHKSTFLTMSQKMNLRWSIFSNVCITLPPWHPKLETNFFIFTSLIAFSSQQFLALSYNFHIFLSFFLLSFLSTGFQWKVVRNLLQKRLLIFPYPPDSFSTRPLAKSLEEKKHLFVSVTAINCRMRIIKRKWRLVKPTRIEGSTP